MNKLIDVSSIQGLDTYILNKFYPVNCRYVQLQGMPDPHSFGGTWELDSNYSAVAGTNIVRPTSVTCKVWKRTE